MSDDGNKTSEDPQKAERTARQPEHPASVGLLSPESQPAFLSTASGEPRLDDGSEALPSYPHALLGDPRLNGRGNAPVRNAAMQQAQRTYGNRAVQRALAGLIGKGTTVADALNSKKPSDVKDISRDAIVAASTDDKIKLLNILVNQGWVGPRDEYKIEEIWGTFGKDLATVASANMKLWEDCIVRGAELETLPEVKKLRADFETDVKRTSMGYLETNSKLVENEMSRLRISPTAQEGEDSQPPAQDNDKEAKEMKALQEAAARVADQQKKREDLGNFIVGTKYQPPAAKDEFGQGTYLFVNFNPFEQPERPLDKNGKPVKPTWEEVKKVYDDATKSIADENERYPTLYSVSREGKSETTSAFAKANPAEAKKQLATALRKLAADINRAWFDIGLDKISMLKLGPIHEQLYAGKASSTGTQWKDPFSKMVAKDYVKDQGGEPFWEEWGLPGLAAVAFLLAPFTGGASLIFTAVGLTATAAKAAIATESAEMLDRMDKTSVKPGTEQVTPEEVYVAGKKAEAAQIELAIAALMAAAEVAGTVVKGMKAAETGAGAVGGEPKSPGATAGAEGEAKAGGTTTTPAGTGGGSASPTEPSEYSPIVPGGGLKAHEGVASVMKADQGEIAHSIAKHVIPENSSTLEYLQDQLAQNATQSKASAFRSRANAEKFVSDALDTNVDKIEKWRQSNKPRLAIHYNCPDAGDILVRGDPAVTSGNKVIVILEKVPSKGGLDYTIITSYPDIR